MEKLITDQSLDYLALLCVIIPSFLFSTVVILSVTKVVFDNANVSREHKLLQNQSKSSAINTRYIKIDLLITKQLKFLMKNNITTLSQ